MNYPSTRVSLIGKLQNGDAVSWDEFYARYAPVIRYVGAYRYRFSADECDDLVQNTMCKFFANVKHYTYREGVAKFRTYFGAVIRSQAVDLIRKNAKNPTVPFEVDDDRFPDPATPEKDPLFMNEWRRAALEEAKDELRNCVSEKTYQAFELYALQNRPAAQVCAALNISRNQLYVAKNRCLAKLCKIIASYNHMDGDLHLEL